MTTLVLYVRDLKNKTYILDSDKDLYYFKNAVVYSQNVFILFAVHYIDIGV